MKDSFKFSYIFESVQQTTDLSSVFPLDFSNTLLTCWLIKKKWMTQQSILDGFYKTSNRYPRQKNAVSRYWNNRLFSILIWKAIHRNTIWNPFKFMLYSCSMPPAINQVWTQGCYLRLFEKCKSSLCGSFFAKNNGSPETTMSDIKCQIQRISTWS